MIKIIRGIRGMTRHLDLVRAKTEKRARQIANDHGGSETGTISDVVYRTGGDPWLNPEYSTCTELLVDGDEEMVLRDFASA